MQLLLIKCYLIRHSSPLHCFIKNHYCMIRFLASCMIFILLLGCVDVEKEIHEDFDFGTAQKGIYQNEYFGLKVTFDPDWSIQDRLQMNDPVKLSSEIALG